MAADLSVAVQVTLLSRKYNTEQGGELRRVREECDDWIRYVGPYNSVVY